MPKIIISLEENPQQLGEILYDLAQYQGSFSFELRDDIQCNIARCKEMIHHEWFALLNLVLQDQNWYLAP